MVTNPLAKEAVSGVRFPTKDNLCTRFATELILRRGSTTNTTADTSRLTSCPSILAPRFDLARRIRAVRCLIAAPREFVPGEFSWG